jgi:hypothetical protein
MVEENAELEVVVVRCVGFVQDLYTPERTLKGILAQLRERLETAQDLEYQDVANDQEAVQSYRKAA